MKWYIWIFFIISLACATEKEKPALHDNFAVFLRENTDFTVVNDSLIACAAGGEDVLVNDAEFPISVLFYPKAGATDFLYFETSSADVEPTDYSNYLLQDLEDAPILQGYLRKFRREAISKNVWGIVSYFRNGEIHISNPIQIKYSDKPTENNAMLLSCFEDEPLSPIFLWEDGMVDENAIYFQVVAEADGTLVSGTYTYEKQFQFYDLSNVVLNIRDVNPAPVLEAGRAYQFIMMAVSEDNWVNLVMKKDFIAE